MTTDERLVFYCHACAEDSVVELPRCTRCGGTEGQITGVPSHWSREHELDEVAARRERVNNVMEYNS